jgi:hypothetical protein
MSLVIGLGRAIRFTAPPAATPLGAREGGGAPVDLDLWLLHTTPSGSERAQHQTVRLSPDGGTFTFGAMQFDTSRGVVRVELSGSFKRYTGASGGEFLLVSMSRVISGDGAPASGLTGTTSSLVGLPARDEVLSFEMVSAGGGRGGRARGGGAGGGGFGGAVGSGAGAARPPGAVGGGATGGGGGGFGGGARASGPNLADTLALLDGHRFSLRLRVAY